MVHLSVFRRSSRKLHFYNSNLGFVFHVHYPTLSLKLIYTKLYQIPSSGLWNTKCFTKARLERVVMTYVTCRPPSGHAVLLPPADRNAYWRTRPMCSHSKGLDKSCSLVSTRGLNLLIGLICLAHGHHLQRRPDTALLRRHWLTVRNRLQSHSISCRGWVQSWFITEVPGSYLDLKICYHDRDFHAFPQPLEENAGIASQIGPPPLHILSISLFIILPFDVI
jgi:hypothetical protein